MRNNHYFLIGTAIGLALLAYATSIYPGGSAFNPNSIGFDWKYNYLCNLFGETAVNGAPNVARSWAIGGWLLLCLTVANFFIRFSTRIPVISSAFIIGGCGIVGMLSAFMAVTSWHNIAITSALVFSMIAVLYVLIFVFKSKLTYLKVLGVATMFFTYAAAYMYYTRTWLEALPAMQKVGLACILIWIFCLNYFTTKADFQASPRINP